MDKTEEYLTYIEDSLKLDDGNGDDVHTRLIKIWSRLSEYLYYSDVTFEKFNREMGYDYFESPECLSEEEEEEDSDEAYTSGSPEYFSDDNNEDKVEN